MWLNIKEKLKTLAVIVGAVVLLIPPPIHPIATTARYKTWGREKLTSADLNAMQDQYTNKINELVAVHPGDSTSTAAGGFQRVTITDSLVVSPGAVSILSYIKADTIAIGAAEIIEAELEVLDGATLSTSELNILDGVTSTAKEINTLDGITSTVTELNILDGVT